jgi:3-isopropylmalate/(R)-2-methylmalate dehydratase small subunit
MSATTCRIDAVEAFTVCTGIAAPLPQANVDTDVIMPKQFLKGITREGLAAGLFYDLRFDGGGCERADFVLNRPEYRSATFLIVGPNFGCGSSREHAVWGLRQYGIRGLIGRSFASIFYDNCIRNGLLPIVLSADAHARVLAACSEGASACVTVDLASGTVLVDDQLAIPFDIDARERDDLLNGRDAIAATLQQAAVIDAFERDHYAAAPWLRPLPPA